MKKIILLFLAFFMIKCASAQLALTDSSYTQNFDGLGVGLPAGWTVHDSASDDGLGNGVIGRDASLVLPAPVSSNDLTHAPAWWEYTSGKFRNFASADGAPYFAADVAHDGLMAGEDTTGFQFVATNRALGCRQVGPTSTFFPGSDPGATFDLTLANTTGFYQFKATFELQSLDSLLATRTSTWNVDYGIGASPTTFHLATTQGNMKTGGNTYSNNLITVDFGGALDNISQPVWIRIGTFSSTSGTGSRAVTAIDNFNLTWSIISGVKSAGPVKIPMQVIATSPNSITIDFSLQQHSSYRASVYDMTGREVYSEKLVGSAGRNVIAIETPNELASGMYIVRLEDENTYGVTKAIITR